MYSSCSPPFPVPVSARPLYGTCGWSATQIGPVSLRSYLDSLNPCTCLSCFTKTLPRRMSSASMRLGTPAFSLRPCVRLFKLCKTEKLKTTRKTTRKTFAPRGYYRKKKHICKAFKLKKAAIYSSTVLYGESKSYKTRCQPHTLGVYSTERRKPGQTPPQCVS